MKPHFEKMFSTNLETIVSKYDNLNLFRNDIFKILFETNLK